MSPISTSALSPSETMREKPIRWLAVHSSIALAIESDWVTKARSPAGGMVVAAPVFRCRPGTITPTRSGPTTRRPRCLAVARTARLRGVERVSGGAAADQVDRTTATVGKRRQQLGQVLLRQADHRQTGLGRHVGERSEARFGGSPSGAAQRPDRTLEAMVPEV